MITATKEQVTPLSSWRTVEKNGQIAAFKEYLLNKNKPFAVKVTKENVTVFSLEEQNEHFLSFSELKKYKNESLKETKIVTRKPNNNHFEEISYEILTSLGFVEIINVLEYINSK